MSNIIAFDQSTTCTGYAIFENEELVQFGCFRPKNSLNADERISQTCIFLKKVLDTVPEIDQILLEDIQFQRTMNGGYINNNIQTFKTLAKLQGAMICTCIEKEKTYKIISPSHWKSIVGIQSKYRRDQKKECIELVDEIFGENAEEDESDAICIGYSYIKENRT